MRYWELRRAVVEAFRFMEERGLNWGHSGNVSVRLPGGLYLISPSGLRKSRMGPEDLVVIDGEGRVVEGSRPPSSEYRLHLAVYRARGDVNAVIHAHPLYASVLAALRKPILPIVEEVTVYLGGPVEVAAYAPPGSGELAENAVRALGDRCAVLLANHGALTCGSDLEEALDALVYLERAAFVYFHASLLGGAQPVPPEALELERRMYLARRRLL